MTSPYLQLFISPSPLMPLIKLTTLHHKHIALGANITDQHGWQVPERYTTPEDELRRVREGVGLCDISPMGKWDVKGNDVKDGQWSMVNGQWWRLAHDHTLFTTVTEQAEEVGRVLRQQAADCAHITDLTSTLAGLYLIGPRSREVLSKLTALNLTDSALPDRSCVQTSVAKVHAIVARLDVSGLRGYQIFVTRDYAEFVWDAVMEAGVEFGIALVGIATLRQIEHG
jgi:sarcosine oxidase subunit alpha